MADHAFVWIWLPGQTEPIVAGRVFRDGPRLSFNYGRSYLARPDAVALYLPELPLEAGAIAPLPGLAMPSALRDGVIGSGDRDGIDGIGADQLAGFIDLTAQIFPSDRRLDRSGDVAARHLGAKQGIAEPGEQPDLAVDSAPVALERGVRAVLLAPEHLSQQAVEHQHRIVGDTTVEYDTVSTSRGIGWGENRAGPTESIPTHVSARRLATPDEIMRMRPDQVLLLRQGERPLPVEKIRYYDQREFAGLFDPT